MTSYPALMPKSTQRAHPHGAEWRGDTRAAIIKCGRGPVGKDGVKAIDCNMFTSIDGVGFLKHWPKPITDGFDHIIGKDGKIRPMTKAERNRPIYKWHSDQVKRWRAGPSRKGRKCITYARAVQIAVRFGALIVGELKDPRFGKIPLAQRVHDEAVAAGHPPWFMALGWMKGARRKCAAAIQVGSQFALIFGDRQRFRKVMRPRVAAWTFKPTRWW